MKKRLRKKLHLGEFREMGFRVRFHFTSVEREPRNAAIDAFIYEVERLGLLAGGGGLEAWEVYVTPAVGSATNEHREQLGAWLTRHELIKDPVVEPLTDAYWLEGRRRRRARRGCLRGRACARLQQTCESVATSWAPLVRAPPSR